VVIEPVKYCSSLRLIREPVRSRATRSLQLNNFVATEPVDLVGVEIGKLLMKHHIVLKKENNRNLRHQKAKQPVTSQSKV